MMKRLALAVFILATSAKGFTQAKWENKGEWTSPTYWGICAIHMTLLPNEKLLVWNWNRDRPNHDLFEVKLVSSSSGTHDYAAPAYVPFNFWPIRDHEVFCAGHVPLADGNLFVAGGHRLTNVGVAKCKLFDWESNRWITQPDMTPYPDTTVSSANGRWYPTVIGLPNGDFALLSGTRDFIQNYESSLGATQYNNYAELWTPPTSNLEAMISRTLNQTTGAPILINRLDRYYPHAFIHPETGKLLVLGSSDEASEASSAGVNRTMDPATLAWMRDYPYENGPGGADDVPCPKIDYPSSVMVDGVIVRSGGSMNGAEDATAQMATANAAFLNLNPNQLTDLPAKVGVWYKAPPMGPNAGKMRLTRKNHTLTALPDGKVLAMGGCYMRNNPNNAFGSIVGAEACAYPEVYDPLQPKDWTPLAGPAGYLIGRPYHSTALLLPDARVIIAGGESEYPAQNVDLSKRTMQMFSPPYGGMSEKGAGGWRSQQPAIEAAPTEIRCGESFSVTLDSPVAGRTITTVSMISLGSTTHAFNANQQVVMLHRRNQSALSLGSVSLVAPASTKIARPGYYMLFAVDNLGIPSNAKIIRLRDYEPFGLISAALSAGTGTASSVMAPEQLRMAENSYFGGKITSNASRVAELIVDFRGDFTSATRIRSQVECMRLSGTNVTLRVSAYDFRNSSWYSLGEALMTGTEASSDFTSVAFPASSDFFDSLNAPVHSRLKLTWSSSGTFSFKLDAVRLGIRQ